MNKRIQKKIQKSLNYHIKMGKLRLEPGDTVLVKVDTLEESYDLICIIFETINDFAKSHGCDCLLTAKEVDIDLLNKNQINWMKEIINRWESVNNG